MTPKPGAPDPAAHVPQPVDMSEESVAGEEDPGASLDGGAEEPAASGPRPEDKPKARPD